MYIIATMLYYHYFIIRDMRHEIRTFSDHLWTICEKAADRVQDDYPDSAKITRDVDRLTSSGRFKLSIYDSTGDRITESDHRKHSILNIEQKYFTVVGKNNIYILELSYPFSINNFSKLNSVYKLRNFSVLFFLVLLIILTAYLHFSLTKPLTRLHLAIEQVNYRHIQIPDSPSYKHHDEVGDLERKFYEMLQRLEASHQEQTEMIASISHDLKTPLTSILGYLERLQSGKSISPEKLQEYHQIIEQKALDMKELITEFADYAYSDTGRDNMVFEKIPLRQFCQDLAIEYSNELEAYGVVFDYRNDIPDHIYANMDPMKMRRVFANLVQNAVKYAEGMNRILFKSEFYKNEAVLSIEDNGQGVPPEELPAIFNKFYRIDKSRSPQKGGCGLGLAICRSIVEIHGGSIEAQIGEYGGLKVVIHLPAVTS